MLQKIIERELSSGFASLPGTQITGKLPIPGAVINQALKDILAKKNGPVKGVMVAMLEGNKAVAVIAIDQFLLPKTLELPFTIEPTVAQGGKLIVTVHIEPPGGLVGALIPMLAGLMSGVSAQGTTLTIDLGEQLKEKSGHDFSHLMERLELSTRRGFLDVAFSLRVPEQG